MNLWSVLWFGAAGLVLPLLSQLYVRLLLRLSKWRSTLARVFGSTLLWLGFGALLVLPLLAYLALFHDELGPHAPTTRVALVAVMYLCSVVPTLYRVAKRMRELRGAGYKF